MSEYEVYVTCDQCGRSHSVHVKLMLEGSEFDKARLADVFPDGKLPPALVFMQSNKYRCPHTKQLFPANDIEQAMLMAL